MIRLAKSGDAKAVADIYNYYISNTNITFEESLVSVEKMQERIEYGLQNKRWFVFEDEGKVVGFAYAGAWRQRSAYKYTVESSVYLDIGAKGKGIGTKLQKHLMRKLKEQGVHVIIAGIAIPNEQSVYMHEKLGFKKVAHFEEVGTKFDRRIDWILADCFRALTKAVKEHG